jgi:formylglycine-generating enzyme required for sulfatase activity
MTIFHKRWGRQSLSVVCLVVPAILGLATSPLLAQKIDFQTDIAPILAKGCVDCHHAGSELDVTSRSLMVQKRLIVPGKPGESSLYTSMRDGLMPPEAKAPQEEIAKIRSWIQQGAPWPANAKVEAPASQPSATPSPAGPGLAEVQRIRGRILANQKNGPGTKQYTVTIPETTVSYGMVAIPAGSFTMGSNAKKDEQPPHKVQLDAFWMQAHEVTWDEFRLFMFEGQGGAGAHKDETVDAVSRPTRPYVEMSFGMGINGFPAISMTQHAANKYAEWLSAKTGEFYRLPTEAEWEYACRAGATTDYYFGSDAAQLPEYAWFKADSGNKYQKVATKKPNAWGLFDMLGNVMEWTLDQYAPYQAGNAVNPWVKPTKPYPIVARGGSWNDPASDVTCTARVGSDPSWKQQDPQLPKSIWWETDAQWLGFRLVRPAKVPRAEEMYRYWNNGVEHDEQQ